MVVSVFKLGELEATLTQTHQVIVPKQMLQCSGNIIQ